MQTALLRGLVPVKKLFPVLALAACAMSTGACAVPESEAAPASPLPSPGTVEVLQPLQLAERARVPEKETGFVSAEVAGGRIQITHDGRLPAFTDGDVLAGTQGGGYLARVTGARALDATHVALETEPAHLTEFLTAGELRVHYDARAHARRIEEHFARQAEREEEDGERIASHAQALAEAGSPIPLLDLIRVPLPAGCGVPADSTADIDVTAELTPAIDLDLEIGPRGGLNPLPEVKRLRLVASGQLDVTARLSGTGTIEGDCQVDLGALAGGLVSVPLPPLTFWVGPVPVVVTVDVVPTATAEVELAIDAAEIAAEAHATAQIEAGVHYEDETWSTVWDPYCDATGTVTAAAPGAMAASCTVAAGAELRTRLYGVVGPSVGVEAYARAQAETAPPYCTYDAWIDGGVRAYAQAEIGLTLGPLDVTLAELELVELELAHFEGPHLSGPLSDAPECGPFD